MTRLSNDTFLKTMIDLADDAGKIAMEYLEKSKPSYKKDQSIVTLADKAISKLVGKRLAPFLSNKNHLLIEEEDPNVSKTFDKDILNRAEYIWSVDPIDGTRNYANQMPNFGISIGLMKDLKPVLGVVYFPFWKELFYCDGKKAFYVKNAFTKQEIRRQIKPIHKPIDNRTYFLATDTFFKHFDWDHKDCRLMIQSAAVIELLWPAIGRGCAGLIKCSLWDLAGSWPILRAAGMELRALSTGKVLDWIDLSAFDPRIPWRLNDFYVISDQKNFLELKKKIRKK